ncbi:hypothetical protein D9M68_862680 [compost metagenome]
MMGLPGASAIHCAVGSSSGSPARKSALRLERSWFLMNEGSYFLSARTAVGALNITLTLYFSTRRHQMPPSGRIGRPSYMMLAMPAINGP